MLARILLIIEFRRLRGRHVMLRDDKDNCIGGIVESAGWLGVRFTDLLGDSSVLRWQALDSFSSGDACRVRFEAEQAARKSPKRGSPGLPPHELERIRASYDGDDL